MSILIMAILASAFPGAELVASPQDLTPIQAVAPQDQTQGASSYPEREAASESLGDFTGGQVIFVAPYDLFLVALLVGIIVLIIIL